MTLTLELILWGVAIVLAIILAFVWLTGQAPVF
jgi:hypothetical protein